MSLSDTALVTLNQAKIFLRINAAASLHINAEYVGVGDGNDKTFDLDNTPIDGSLRLYVDGTLQVEATDFTISGVTVTFVTAPASPKPITASYVKAAADNTFESYDDDLLEKLIEAATKKAEDYTGRAFIQREIAEESHFADGSAWVKLYRQPIQSVSSVVKKIFEVIGTGTGSAVTFTLDETPAGSIKLYVDAVLQVLTEDYTISDKTITFTSAPSDGAKITAEYTHLILKINEYTEKLSVGRLYCDTLWENNELYLVTYTAGYGSTRENTQDLIPDALLAVLEAVAFWYENRMGVKSSSVYNIGSVNYDDPDTLPLTAKKILDSIRVKML